MKLLPSKEEFTLRASQEYRRQVRNKAYLFSTPNITGKRVGDRDTRMGTMFALAFDKAMDNLYDWLETREGL